MDLSGLPQFSIERVRAVPGTIDTVLVGYLSHLRGVRNTTAWLYRSSGPSLIGTVAAVPATSNDPVQFTTSDLALAPELRVGSVYPWVDGYWNAYQITMILAGQWELRTFTTGPAHFFRLAGITGWQPVGAELPAEAEDLGVRHDAWDHEHCELCRARIDAKGETQGFVDAHDHWLCRGCYERYAQPHDISFAAEA